MNMKIVMILTITLAALAEFRPAMAQSIPESNHSPSMRKIRDVIIYRDTRFHSAFPSVVRRPDGTILLAFRRAPDRSALGAKGTSHVDPSSYLVKVITQDGVTWQSPELLYAHHFGGYKDPFLFHFRAGGLL